jgi:hypothetical protein
VQRIRPDQASFGALEMEDWLASSANVSTVPSISALLRGLRLDEDELRGLAHEKLDTIRHMIHV